MVAETVGELGEFGLIAAIRERLGPAVTDTDQVLLGPGDDAAVLAAPGGRSVVTTDLLIEGRHFQRNWSAAYDVGVKAAAQNLADIAAMGALPSAILVGLGAPAELPVAWVLELADGLCAECERAGAAIVGGDIVDGDDVVLAVTAFGRLEERGALGALGAPEAPLTRGGTQVGDVVAVCGRLGWSEAGLAVLGRGFGSPRAVVEAHRRPQPVYDAGPEAAALGATALIDASDGLLADLGHIARASRTQIDVETHRLDVPEPLQTVGRALGVEPLDFVLSGGEDHALVATFPPEVALPERWYVVGRVVSAAADSDLAVTVDGAAYDGSAGHDHYR